MVDSNESTAEGDARIQSWLEIGIPDFLRHCGKIQNQLKSIGDNVPCTTDKTRLEMLKVSYDAWRSKFANGGTPFIDFKQTPFNLISRSDTASRVKARGAVCSANLVALLTAILDIKEGKTRAVSILQKLDDAFPVLFKPTFQGHRDGFEETFELAFRIRCRHLVELLADSSRRPVHLAASIFCDKITEGSANVHQLLMEGPYRQLADIDVNKDDVPGDIYQSYMKELVPRISNGSKSQIQVSLDDAYPQDALLTDLRTWALTNLKRLTASAPTLNGKFGQTQKLNRNSNDGVSESLFVDASEHLHVDSDSGSESEDVYVPEMKGPK